MQRSMTSSNGYSRAHRDGVTDQCEPQRVDEAVRAIAWAIYEPTRAKALAELAVTDTGLGNVTDKITKNQRKTSRCATREQKPLASSKRMKHAAVKYAKPVGVVAAVCPSTNPAATPANSHDGCEGRNAVIIAPSPAGFDHVGHG